MTPTFRIVADGADITGLINDRLLLLRTTDKPGMESDDFELRIDDRDSAVSLPSRGASIEIFLGYTGTALTRLGRYTVDEVELSGPPDTLVIRGKASGSWEGVSLASIVNDVAARNGWLPVCPVVTEVPRADQLSESDFNFITRLAKQYDCTAKVADGKLLVMPRQAGQSASGLLLGAITLTRSDVSRWQFRLADRSAHKAVSTKHQDPKTGKLQIITLNNDDAPDGLPPVHTDRHIYPNKSAAEQAAKARLSAFNIAVSAVTLVHGRLQSGGWLIQIHTAALIRSADCRWARRGVHAGEFEVGERLFQALNLVGSKESLSRFVVISLTLTFRTLK